MEEHELFFKKNGNLEYKHFIPETFDYDWVMYQSKWPWLELAIDIPFKVMYEEAIALEDMFVDHRWNDKFRGYKHHGWKSLAIHGIDSQKTENFHAYGYKSQEETPYNWTEIKDKCPKTIEFLKSLPFENKFRIRFMLLEPGGYIYPHKDQEDFSFYPINIALNHPDGCKFAMDDIGVLPFKSGKAFHMNLAYRHSVVNYSNEKRFHLIIHALPGSKKEQHKQLLERSFLKLKNEQASKASIWTSFLKKI